MAYKEKQYIIQPLIDLLEGKNPGLYHKNLKILRFLGNALLPSLFNVICPALALFISLIIWVSMYNVYCKYNIYNPVIHSLWAIYYSFVVFQMVYSLLLAFTIIISLSLLMKFRFNGVNKFFKSKNMNIITKAITKHKILCDQVEEMNNIISIHLTIPFLAVTLAWDIAFYLTLYGQNSLLRFVMGNCSFLLLFGTFFAFFSSVLIVSEAHKPYEEMNSLMTKKCLNYRLKWKVSLTCLNS